MSWHLPCLRLLCDSIGDYLRFEFTSLQFVRMILINLKIKFKLLLGVNILHGFFNGFYIFINHHKYLRTTYTPRVVVGKLYISKVVHFIVIYLLSILLKNILFILWNEEYRIFLCKVQMCVKLMLFLFQNKCNKLPLQK